MDSGSGDGILQTGECSGRDRRGRATCDVAETEQELEEFELNYVVVLIFSVLTTLG